MPWADGLVALEPGRLEVGLVVDQIRVGATAVRDLDEAACVRARLRPDDEDERGLFAIRLTASCLFVA